jgi:uncharacterized membrane protein YfbV (UPF0208 family)
MASITNDRTSLEKVAILISTVTLLCTIVGWVWFGGGLAQRVITNENSIATLQKEVNSGRDLNSRQDSDIAVTKAQYAEIIQRLNRIDEKLDRRR